MKFLAVQVLALFLQGCGCSTVSPGNRGVLVTMGEVDTQVYAEGLVWHKPLVATINEVNVQQQKSEITAPCFSSDLQEVDVKVSVIYRIPEANVILAYRDYKGSMFDLLVAPRVQETLKELTSAQTAEAVAKNREKIKVELLATLRAKVGTILVIEDVMIENVALSKSLTAAIDAKMVQQQEAAKAEFTKQKARVEAETVEITARGAAQAFEIKAKGEAAAIESKGLAIRNNPAVIKLMQLEKWNGAYPKVVSGGASTLMLNVDDK